MALRSADFGGQFNIVNPSFIILWLVTRCVALLEVDITRCVRHSHKLRQVFSDNTEVGYGNFLLVPINPMYPKIFLIPLRLTNHLNHWYKKEEIYSFMLFAPTSDPSVPLTSRTRRRFSNLLLLNFRSP